MELLLPLLASLLVATGVYLLLSRAIIRLIIGLSMISYGMNLSILLAGSGGELAAPPLLYLSGPFVDPLPQALILTAIVIGFATTALLLVLAMRAYQETGTDHIQELLDRPDVRTEERGYADPEHPSVSPERGRKGEKRDEEGSRDERGPV